MEVLNFVLTWLNTLKKNNYCHEIYQQSNNLKGTNFRENVLLRFFPKSAQKITHKPIVF